MLSHVLTGIGIGIGIGLIGVGLGCAVHLGLIPYYTGPWISDYSVAIIIEDVDYVVDMSEEP